MAIVRKSTVPTVKRNHRKRSIFSKGSLCMLSSCFLAIVIYHKFRSTLFDDHVTAEALRDNLRKPHIDSDEKHLEWYEKSQPKLSDWPVLQKRMDVIPILEKLKLKLGIEVGVQRGILAKKSLDLWPSCEEYKLVDLWGMEDGYVEPGGHEKKEQAGWLRQAKHRMKLLKRDTVPEFFIMRSTEAAKQLKDDYFDYVYLDARHDYCAVMEDIEHYYPKLRAGGVLGGHDYIDAQYAIDRLGQKEDWSKCEDGSHHPEAVKGAVDTFAKEKGLYVITSQEDFPSWYIQKPY